MQRIDETTELSTLAMTDATAAPLRAAWPTWRMWAGGWPPILRARSPPPGAGVSAGLAQ